jgi:TetR/AcrR family transcriptional repressor of lmrAB and yxaGH operons
MPNTPKHRDELVRTAMRLFRRQGYSGTGLQQILAESGAPKGSLYHYFPGGKDEIGAAAVELAGTLVAETLADLAARHASPAAFLRAYFRTYAGWMEESGFQSGCPIATTLLETAPNSPAITAAGDAALSRWLEIMQEVFRRDGLDAAAARRRAQLTIASLEGALLLARTARSRAPLQNVARALVEAIG